MKLSSLFKCVMRDRKQSHVSRIAVHGSNTACTSMTGIANPGASRRRTTRLAVHQNNRIAVRYCSASDIPRTAPTDTNCPLRSVPRNCTRARGCPTAARRGRSSRPTHGVYIAVRRTSTSTADTTRSAPRPGTPAYPRPTPVRHRCSRGPDTPDSSAGRWRSGHTTKSGRCVPGSCPGWYCPRHSTRGRPRRSAIHTVVCTRRFPLPLAPSVARPRRVAGSL